MRGRESYLDRLLNPDLRAVRRGELRQVSNLRARKLRKKGRDVWYSRELHSYVWKPTVRLQGRTADFIVFDEAEHARWTRRTHSCP